ncbi:MAG TPA: hypothetical protein DEO70_12180 [Bacteroidales bacterium]|nr:MAG: hypothetical protein A2X11_10170 [Bacteroidetes bacterium GWE2_42_24]OFY25876.1 MAG: hypothetical protein A2X09_09545 [Bacteroidetes bacterium GWF2_43_11]HBZ67586.1 hypothetical protein [Bacteroidales bacterium]
MGLFSIDELKPCITPAPGERDAMLSINFLTLHMQKINSLRDLCGRLPASDELMLLWTLKQFNAFTFIPFIVENAGIILELVISTYSISSKVVDALIALVDRGQVKHIHISISDSVKFRIPRVVDHLESLLQTRGEHISVLYGWNHSKCTLMHTDTGYYVVEGSGNFTENAQHEQYLFYNHPDAFAFRKQNVYGVFT